MENSCRICRFEGTPSQPLIHPCKCRGSIKYIHQDCLLEWLKHSNSSTSKCDICNTSYKFRTIYDPNMPDRIPFKFIWEKFVLMISGTVIRIISVLLFAICVFVQIPIYWKFIGRLYTWAIDGHLPPNNPKLLDALLFGELSVKKMNEDFLAFLAKSHTEQFAVSKWMIFLHKFSKFFEYTVISGFQYVFFFTVSHIALFIEHEWVVRDDGYSKLLLKEVGEEPKVQLIEVIKKAIETLGIKNDDEAGTENQNNQQQQQQFEMMERALKDLQQGGIQEQILEEDLKRFIEERRRNNTNNANAANDNTAIINENAEHYRGEDPFFNVMNNPNHNFAFNFAETDLDYLEEDEGDDEAEAINNAALPPTRQAQAPIPGAEVPGGFIHVRREPELDGGIYEGGPHLAPVPILPPAQAQERQRQPEVVLPPPAPLPLAADIFNENDSEVSDNEGVNNLNDIGHNPIPGNNNNDNALNDDFDDAGGNGDILDILGINLNDIRTPVMLMIFGNAIISVYLFVAYLIPLMLGNAATYSIGRVIGLFNFIDWKAYISYFNVGEHLSLNPNLLRTIFLVNYNVFQPIFEVIQHVFDPTYSNPSHLERFLSLLVGYAILTLSLLKLMDRMVNGRKEPVLGTARKMYKILFEITSTIKVFSIFAIELFLFPIYCGWLLDFSFAPLFLSNFKDSENPDIYYFMVTSAFKSFRIFKDSAFIRLFVYWSSGTLYMLLFAIYVSMIRDSILRPGVLFFIRSPDDPDARLIHNALVRPLLLQLSRIYLCAKVYTAFIVVGIGAVCWFLRYSFQQPEYNVMLPIQILNDLESIITYSVIGFLLLEKVVSLKYLKIYWTFVFEICAHKLRLSHYMLGKLVPQERGYIVYRNIFEQILARQLPDYSKPMSYGAAMKAFKENPSLIACFVPDGNYNRVPDNNTVSRKYLKTLFVPVTKDDKLITNTPKKSNKPSIEDEYESSDDESTVNNAYTIVYRPPHFQKRCVGFVVLLWVFAVLLILLIAFIGLLVGRPVVKAGQIVLDLTQLRSPKALSSFDYRLGDLESLLVGLKIELELLKLWDSSQLKSNTPTPPPPETDILEGFEDVEQLREIVRELNEIHIGGNGNRNQDRFGFFGQEINRQLEQLRRGDINALLGPFRLATVSLIHTITVALWMIWISSVHKMCIDIPFRILSGLNKAEQIFQQPINEFLISNGVLMVHTFVAFFTIFPFCKFLYKRLREAFDNRIDLIDIILVWKTCLLPILVRFAGTHLSIIFVILQYRYGLAFSPLLSPYITSLNLFIFIGYRFSNGILKLLLKINNSVKNEKYVRSKTIENMDDDVGI